MELLTIHRYNNNCNTNCESSVAKHEEGHRRELVRAVILCYDKFLQNCVAAIADEQTEDASSEVDSILECASVDRLNNFDGPIPKCIKYENNQQQAERARRHSLKIWERIVDL